jgi:hypothetical protein
VRARRPGSAATEAGIDVLERQLATHEAIAGDESARVVAIDSTAPPDGAALAARILEYL